MEILFPHDKFLHGKILKNKLSYCISPGTLGTKSSSKMTIRFFDYAE